MDDTTRDEELTRLWRAHHGAVLAYARRRVGEPAAQEVAAEAFVRAWRSPVFASDSEARVWLLSAARGVIANRRRGERRRAALIDRLRRERVEVAPDPALQVGDDGAMRQAFAALSARDRETLTLIAWDGMEVAEAAQVVGCTATVFSGRLFRARRRLEQALTEAEDMGLPLDEREEAR